MAARVFARPAKTPRRIAAEFFASTRAACDAGRPASQPGSPLFTDVAAETGLDFVHDNAARGEFRLPEQLGPGAGFLDYDNDGDLDVFIAGGGAIVEGEATQTCRLYRNDGDRFSDVTLDANAGVAGPAYGVACADYDDDGDVDVFVSRLGPNALLRNDGAGGFVEVAAEIGVADPGFGASAAFFDYDRDGRLDLYVANYVDWSPHREVACYSILGLRDYCGPTVYNAPSQDRLYRNIGDGRFEDVTERSGIGAERGLGLGVVASDFDGDGRPDVYVANDQTPAFYWHNNGDGSFTNEALLRGCAYDGGGIAIAGMGVACEDLDDDGDLDLFVTNIHDQTHLILRNDHGFFTDVSAACGLTSWSLPATGFGIALFDQDHDGRLDGYIANGAVNVSTSAASKVNPYSQPDHFIRLEGSRFIDASAETRIASEDVARAVACADYDNDGDLDLLVTNNGGPVRLLRNNAANGHAWLMVDARLAPSGRAAIGARVRVEAGGRTLVREVRPQQSYLSSGDPRVHFGLRGATRVERLSVTWPDGSTSQRTDVPVNQVLTILSQDGGAPQQ